MSRFARTWPSAVGASLIFEYERVFLRFIEKRAVIERAPPMLRRKILAALMNEEVARSEE
jgi:hypothetical protein